MSKLYQNTKLRALALPLLGFCGGIVAMYFPLGHRAFCAGFGGVVI